MAVFGLGVLGLGVLGLGGAGCQPRPRENKLLAMFYAPTVEQPARYTATYSKVVGEHAESSSYDLEMKFSRAPGEIGPWQVEFQETSLSGEKSPREKLSYLLDEFGYPAKLGRQEDSVLVANRFFGYLLPRLPRGPARAGETWESVIFVRPFVVEIGPPLLLPIRYTLAAAPGESKGLDPFALRIDADFSAEQAIPRGVSQAEATFYCRVAGRARYDFSAASGLLISAETTWEYQVEHRQHTPEPISEKGKITVTLSPR